MPDFNFDIGDIVGYVLPDGRHPGEVRPAIILKIWDRDNGCSNLNVFTDGDNDYPGTDGLLWATSILYDGGLEPEPGTWHFLEHD